MANVSRRVQIETKQKHDLSISFQSVAGNQWLNVGPRVVLQLFLHEGITPGIRRSFVAYLACHNRPIHEVLYPNLRDISADYDNTFRGMTAEPVELQVLLSARERMIAELQAHLDHDERKFLLSLARNEPNWALLGIEHLEQLPGIRWKLRNLEQLAKTNPRKLKVQAQELEALLGKSAR